MDSDDMKHHSESEFKLIILTMYIRHLTRAYHTNPVKKVNTLLAGLGRSGLANICVCVRVSVMKDREV